ARGYYCVLLVRRGSWRCAAGRCLACCWYRSGPTMVGPMLAGSSRDYRRRGEVEFACHDAVPECGPLFVVEAERHLTVNGAHHRVRCTRSDTDDGVRLSRLG